MRDSLPNIFQWYVTFGGPDVNRLRKTGELAGLQLDGALPNAIREFEAAKMKRYHPKRDGKTPREILECATWDMVGPFKTTSIGGARDLYGKHPRHRRSAQTHTLTLSR